MSQFLTLSRTFNASGAIPPRRILAFTATGAIKVAAAATDKLCGVSDAALDVADGRRVDVLMSGFQKLDAGGAIAWGDRLTSDANGKAVVAAAGNNRIAIALQDAAAGDPFDVLITPS
jgi:hypothetical protein